MATIAELLLERRLERVGVDRDEAQALLEHARSHLRSAAKILDDDAPGPYQLAYDATRKAVAGAALEESLRHFDRMLRVRNRIEYGDVTIGRAQVKTDLAHAKEIVRA